MKQLFSTILLVSALATTSLASWHKTQGRSSAGINHTFSQNRATENQWRRLAWLDEHGQIPADALSRAITQGKKLKRPGTRLAGDSWTELGPTNASGRSESLAIDPTNSSNIFAGSAGGGVWHSTDGGTIWSQTTDRQLLTLSVNTVAIDPSNPSTIYAGTGDGLYHQTALPGSGAYRSTDGGTTWNQLPSTSGVGLINQIAVSPSNPNVILLATTSTNSTNGGIYKSSNGGASFVQVHAEAFAPLIVTSIKFSPTNSNSVVATETYLTGFQFGSSILVSGDQGSSFQTAAGMPFTDSSLTRFAVAFAPSSPGLVYASFTDGQLYKSTDGGFSFALASLTGYTDVTWYANSLWVDPTNANFLVIGGATAYKSTDGGLTIKQIGSGGIQTNEPHPYVTSIVNSPEYDGSTNKVVYVTTAGGLFRANDITSATTSGGWSRISSGPNTSTFYSVAGDGPTNTIFGGVDQLGTQSIHPGTQTSDYTYGGSGGFVAIDPQQTQYQYGEDSYGQVWRSIGGQPNSGQLISGTISEAGNSGNPVAPLVIDQNQPQTLYVGLGSLWRTTNARDASPLWTTVKSGTGSPISAIAVAPGNSDIVWVGHNDGTIYVTGNGTDAVPTWTQIQTGPGTVFPGRMITRILVDSANSNVIYVSQGGFTSGNLVRSSDGGASWTVITGTNNAVLPQVPIRAIARDTLNGNILYVGTEIGIFSTSDGGLTWSTSSDALAFLPVTELAYLANSSTLVASTYGRGVWVLNRNTAKLASVTFAAKAIGGGNAVSGFGTVTLTSAAPANGVPVSLSSDNPAAFVPARILVPAGQRTATFDVATTVVSANQIVNVTAKTDTNAKTSPFTVTVASAGTINFSSTVMSPNSTTTASIKLSGLANPFGVTVNLSTDNPLVKVSPTTVNVVGGTDVSSTFTLTSAYTSKDVRVNVTAVVPGTTPVITPILVQHVTVQSLQFAPNSVFGGLFDLANIATGTVTLEKPTPTPIAVTVFSAIPSLAATPATVTFGAGSYTATFTVATVPVSKQNDVVINARFGVSTASSKLSILAPKVLGLVISPNPAIGGNTVVPTTGTITLSSPSPAGGISVKLLSSNKDAATVPTSVVVPAGTRSVTFPVTTKLVKTQLLTTISATLNGTQSQVLTVNPISVTKVIFTPSAVPGGTNAKGTVVISAPAPAGGATVSLSTVSTLATPDANVVIPAGFTSANFNVTTVGVDKDTTSANSPQIVASYLGSSNSGTLYLQAAQILRISSDVSTVSSTGKPAKVTVTLTGAAGPSGIVVNLYNSTGLDANPAITMPTSLSIPKGQFFGTFSATPHSVSALTHVTVSARLNSTTRNITINVTP